MEGVSLKGSSYQPHKARLSVVLVDPEIPWNAGNIGRTCVAVGATLHLVGRLGFKVESKEIRRSGLDYWPRLKWRRHEDFEAFLGTVPEGAPLFFFSSKSRRTYWEAPYLDGSYLVFGKESTGLDPGILKRMRGKVYRIPMRKAARSLNLSTAAGVVLYEALRVLRRSSGP